jgi:hypothetical protein
MNAAPRYFGRDAKRLARAGYDVIPISRHDDQTMVWRKGEIVPLYTDPGKQPAQPKDWQNGCPREDWPRYASCGVGILTRCTPALDIDVLDAELAETIQGIADRVLGDAPYRIGQAPKRLMPFRLVGEPFPKMKVIWRGVGDELHEPTKPPAVELLLRGQQFVALGVHPKTGRPYEWHRDPDLSIPHGLLPPINQAKAERFMGTLASALKSIGATDIKFTGGPVAPKVDTRPTRRPVTTKTDAERISAAMERIGNHDLHYDDWIRIGYAIKAALPGGDGRAIWEWWSSLSSKNDPALTRKTWERFDPRTISAGTIFYLARESNR